MVKMPPLLLGLTLLFWGWEVELLPLSAVGAVILELPRFIRWRWDFSETDMNRFWDLCYVLFLSALAYSFVTTDVTYATFKFLLWLPLIFFPFVAATAYSAEDCVRLSTFSLFLHRKGREAGSAKPIGWFVSYGYFAICFIAASIVNARDPRFYTAVVVLGAWLLWTIRSRVAPIWMWTMMLVVVSVAGSGGQVGLTELQAWIEDTASRLLTGSDEELTQTRTAIGSIGQLKLSNRIVLRVETNSNSPAPALLRRASFNLYDTSGRKATWLAAGTQFASLQPGPEPTTWVLSERGSSLAATISMSLSRGTGIIPVPNGPCILEGLIAGVVEANRCGSVRVRDSLPLVRYTVKYCGVSTLDAPPNARDLAVPAAEVPAVAQITGELGLAGQSPEEVMRRLATFFHGKFTYRTHLKTAADSSSGQITALNRFLLHDRAGHCEFFATATTLLLRQAGIPARYATGYAVPPKTGAAREHLVRRRHAHAWVLVHVDGTWRDFDTTPAAWGGMEDAEASVFQSLGDLISSLQYRFARWRYYGDRAALINALLWFVPILMLWFSWRLFWKKRRVRLQGHRQREQRPRYAGADSEFYLIEKHLTQAGLPRREGEPLGEWLRRLEAARRAGMRIPSLEEIVVLHYAYRFDPLGITAAQRRELKSRAESWLKEAAGTAAAS
ncbi:MAG: DUF4129 domain-containing transglutaminase family protein [Verrucomicrobia bacterium]|nr:DUF4129 domain-containing transglutaminase family protein [Verrucomicrobiota bacterium]